MSRADLEDAFASGDGEKIGSALLSAFYTQEPGQIERWCLKFASHQEPLIRQLAIEILGNTAALRRSEVDLVNYRKMAEQLCRDPDEGVRMAARDALDDVLRATKLKEGTQS